MQSFSLSVSLSGVLSLSPISSQELCSWSCFYHSLLFITVATVALFRLYGSTCVYIIPCAAPTWDQLEGRWGFSVGHEGAQRRTITRQRILYGEAVCICVLESLSTSESPEVNAVHYNIHEAAGLLSWVKAKPDMTKLTPQPSALRVKWPRKGQMRHSWRVCLCMCVHVCGESSLCAHESHLFRNCNSFMISEITVYIPSLGQQQNWRSLDKIKTCVV